MKDIKTFLIGFLSCCCMFLIMGQTNYNHNSKFQISSSLRESNSRIYHTILNTQNGEIIARIVEHTRNYENISK